LVHDFIPILTRQYLNADNHHPPKKMSFRIFVIDTASTGELNWRDTNLENGEQGNGKAVEIRWRCTFWKIKSSSKELHSQ
jgi:hypothetical protein